jgi:hypothetical protein
MVMNILYANKARNLLANRKSAGSIRKTLIHVKLLSWKLISISNLQILQTTAVVIGSHYLLANLKHHHIRLPHYVYKILC